MGYKHVCKLCAKHVDCGLPSDFTLKKEAIPSLEPLMRPHGFTKKRVTIDAVPQ
jgi:hypothetical protein